MDVRAINGSPGKKNGEAARIGEIPEKGMHLSP